METSEIRLIWTGKEWETRTDGVAPGLEPGTEFLLRVPVARFARPSAAPATEGVPGKQLFPAGTWLYLPLNLVKNEDKAWALWVSHREELRPALAEKQERPLIPILLDEDLRFANAESRGLASCRCRIGSREFESLNQAASYALLEWTNSDAGAINVFDRVRFIYDKALVRLRDQRSHLLDGDPLPENPDLDDGTPDMFEKPHG